MGTNQNFSKRLLFGDKNKIWKQRKHYNSTETNDVAF